MRTPVTDLLHCAVAAFAALPPFAGYVDPDRLLVVGCRGRRGPHGRRAACHFTRFRETRTRVSPCGRFELPLIQHGAREIRYVISFVLPRFLFLSPDEQAEDVVHELLHIDPAFDGCASALRHGPRYDARVRDLAAAAQRRGLAMPPLGRDGDVVFFRRFRPFPDPYRIADRRATRRFDETRLELAAIVLDPRDREPPPPRYLYVCPVCGARFPRQRRLRLASCGRCSSRYDRRFNLELS